MDTLFLYDIDGTLISARGAGRRCLELAFSELFGVPDAFQEVHFGGRTDPGITDEAFERAGIQPTDEDRRRLKERYLALLQLHPFQVQLHPGVREALQATARLGLNALLTGNWREGARLKLSPAGLWGDFPFGAFGDDAKDRDHLVPVAVERARRAGFHPRRVVVVGDTEADVSCARAAGALAVVVETGFARRELLERSPPDLLLPDLERGLPALLSFLGGGVGAAGARSRYTPP